MNVYPLSILLVCTAIGGITQSQLPPKNYNIIFTVQAPRESVEQNIRITNERLKAAGYTSDIKKQNDSTYSVSIHQTADTAAIRDALTKNAKLSFYETYNPGEIGHAFSIFLIDWEPILKGNLPSGAFKKLGKKFFEEKKNLASVLVLSQPRENNYGGNAFPPHIGLCKEADSSIISTYLNSNEVMKKFPADCRFIFGEYTQDKPTKGPLLYVYAVRKKPNKLSNSSISEAKPSTDEMNKPEISLWFNEEGTKQWAKLTEWNIGKALAICINDQVALAPVVIEKILSGACRITGLASTEASRVLSVLITSEELLLPVKIIQTKTTPIAAKPGTSLSRPIPHP
jgi:preprotein translocase subunit SecD